MQTYNQASLSEWTGYYNHIVNANVDRTKVGVGVYPFAEKNGTWPSTPASVAARIGLMEKDGVPEVFVFRFLFQGTTLWPWPKWWEPLAAFLQGL